MRKFFTGIVLLLASVTMFAEQRSVEDAAAIAADFSQAHVQKSGNRRAPRKAAKMSLVHQVAKPSSSEAALYVFNNSNGGWVIVSADDKAVSILG